MNTKITVLQISKICNVKPDTVRKWFLDGLLNGHKELQCRSMCWVTTIEDLYIFLTENEKHHKIKSIQKEINEKLYTTKDLCDIFGVSRETVRNWRNCGYLKSCSELKKKPCCYTESEVVKFVANRPKYYYLFLNRTTLEG